MEFKSNGRVFTIASRPNASGGFVVRLRWRVDGKRKEKRFPDVAAAKAFARTIAKQAPGGTIELHGDDAVEYSEMQRLKPGAVSILEIYKIGLEQWEMQATISSVGDKWVEEACQLFIDSKTITPEYRRILTIYLNKFSAAFQMPLRDVRQDDAQTWLDGMKASDKTKYQMASYLRGLLYWAQKRNAYPPGEITISIAKPVQEEITIYSIPEIRAILKVWPRDLLPGIVIQMFAGLRTAEIERLDWSEVRESGIVVMAAKSKTRRRRVAPMLPVLKAWLDHLGWPESGRVAESPTRALSDQYGRTATALGVTWKRNALRHSFCSCRLAATKNAAATAYEAGHSEAKQRENYDAVVSEEDGKNWFKISP